MMTDDQINRQRKKNNRWLALILAGFVVLVFFVTVVKLRGGGTIEGFDHTIRPNLLEQDIK